MRAALGKGHDSFEMDQRKEPATPHPGPLPVRGGEGEAFVWFVWFAVHLIRPVAFFGSTHLTPALIRPPATFSHPMGEGIFCGT